MYCFFIATLRWWRPSEPGCALVLEQLVPSRLNTYHGIVCVCFIPLLEHAEPILPLYPSVCAQCIYQACARGGIARHRVYGRISYLHITNCLRLLWSVSLFSLQTCTSTAAPLCSTTLNPVVGNAAVGRQDGSVKYHGQHFVYACGRGKFGRTC